jgi:putative addiction module antidote
MSKLKIISIDNSAGVLLPTELLTKLGLGVGGVLQFTETERGIKLTVDDPEFDAQMAVAEDIMQEHVGLLRKLAK